MADAPRSHAVALPEPFVRLGSYLHRAVHAAHFPLYGIYYFVRRPFFYPLFLGRLLPLSIISLLVYVILFAFAFLPQFAFLAIFHGWGAWLNAVVLVLGEGLVIIQGLFEGFFVDECRVDVFDATLLDRGCIDLVAPQRLLFPDAPDPVRMLGQPTVSAAYQPWSLVQIVELAACLPLNLIPYVGTPAFILITGTRLGKLSLYRWHKLRGLSRKERKQEIRARTWDCVWFGSVVMILELIPLFSFFFLLSSAAASALWVAEIEKRTPSVIAAGAAPAAPSALAAPAASLSAPLAPPIEADAADAAVVAHSTAAPVHYEDDPV